MASVNQRKVKRNQQLAKRDIVFKEHDLLAWINEDKKKAKSSLEDKKKIGKTKSG